MTSRTPDACLIVIRGPRIGERLVLTDDSQVVGRGQGCDLQLFGGGVSRFHFRIDCHDGPSRLVDLGSTNGTEVNGVRVQAMRLADGDLITVGDMVLKFVDRRSPEADYHAAVQAAGNRDALTGLHNRRYILEQLATAISRCQRHADSPLSLVLLDLDLFKSVNDKHGHLAGDAVLRELARLLKDTQRDGDVCARIGGEEFALLLPATDRKTAWQLADHLRARVAGHRFQAEGVTLGITLSGGVVAWHSAYETPSDFLRAVDSQLYQAKEAGRNRVKYQQD